MQNSASKQGSKAVQSHGARCVLTLGRAPGQWLPDAQEEEAGRPAQDLCSSPAAGGEATGTSVPMSGVPWGIIILLYQGTLRTGCRKGHGVVMGNHPTDTCRPSWST